MNGLEALCFDVLGDFVDPRAIRIDEEAKTVRVPRLPSPIREIVEGEWKAATAGTGYDGYRLIIGSSERRHNHA
jgi:hypothetical protein